MYCDKQTLALFDELWPQAMSRLLAHIEEQKKALRTEKEANEALAQPRPGWETPAPKR